MNSSSNVISKTNFIALSFLVMLSLILAILAFSFGGVDYCVYYAAGRVFLQGGNPYDYSQLVVEIISSTGKSNNPYYYAPWFTWAISPLALLPFMAARILWAVINFVLWFWGLFNLSKLITTPPIGWRRWGMYFLVTFLFAWATWGSEQVGILIFIIFTAVVLSYVNERFISMGIWMALLLFKPNITAFPVIILSLWLMLRGRWKPIISMTETLILMTVISLIVSPDWYLEFFQTDKIVGLSYTLNQTGEIQTLRYTTTLMEWLAAYDIVGTPAYVVYVLAFLAGALFVGQEVYKSQSVIQLTAIALLVNFALIPYALFYDYSSLVITLFFINAEFAKESLLIWVVRIMNVLLVSSLFIGDNIAYRYWIIVILALSVLIKNIYVGYESNTVILMSG